MNDYSFFFSELLNKNDSKFSPYPFQINCFEKFSSGKSILLQAPTGSGKTWAALAPFIFHWAEWKKDNQDVTDYPRKLIYSLPLRTLANSLFKEVKSQIKQNMSELNLKVTMQTGEYPSDPFLEGDIIFTTIDQTLSSILSIPLSLPTKLANINAGAVISSYLIFDEFHLLDPQRSLNTTISILELLKDICPFCLMTATLSDQFLDSISNFLNADVVRIKNEEYQQFGFVKKKAERLVSIIDEPMNTDRIINEHRQKSIVICNTVDRCVDIYKALQQIKDHNGMDIELICIHSRFFQNDRKEKEAKIKELFSAKSKANVILVSTQIVEVGLDISCDVMHTELCPINAFLQRIGRCARWGGQGKVCVYDLPDEKYMPYDKELCKATKDALVKINDQSIDFYSAKILINDVLETKESEIFRQIKNNNTWPEIRECWQRNDKGKARELIRNINSISVVLLPEGLKTNFLYKYDSLSISPYSLKYKIQQLADEYEGEIPSYVLDLEDDNFIDDEINFEETKRLQPMDFNNIPQKNIIALNSELIGYSTEYGMDFDNHFGYQSEKIRQKEKIFYSYNKDTYDEHIKRMIAVYEEKINYHFLFPIRKIQAIKYSEFDFSELIKYMIIMHDYGKLSMKWQKIMNSYQKAKDENINRQDEFLTHTDFDPQSDSDKNLMKETERKLKLKKPKHSGVGAFVSYFVLSHVLAITNDDDRKIVNIILTAILKHHGATTTNMPKYEVSNEAIDFINRELVKTILPEFYVTDTDKFPFKEQVREKDLSSTHMSQFNSPIEAFTYFILVRILRLCDQKSFDT